MIELKEKIVNPLIIEGFPGFGLASTIATEFLIKHLNAKKVGRIFSTKLSPIIAIHDSEILDPLGIYYVKEHNIVILRALTAITGAEWEIAEKIIEFSKKVKAKEIISLEGMPSEKLGKSKAYYFTSMKGEKFKNVNIENLKDGLVFGVTGILLLRIKELPLTCIFADANPTLPDSRAAAEIIRILDDYLNLKIDFKPLIKNAEQFENKLKQLLSRVGKTSKKPGGGDMSYLG
jgi:uncharacterized protein